MSVVDNINRKRVLVVLDQKRVLEVLNRDRVLIAEERDEDKEKVVEPLDEG